MKHSKKAAADMEERAARIDEGEEAVATDVSHLHFN